MAPRGIVAAATASTFSAGLVKAGVGGADKILPITFLVIGGTVALYGLTAKLVARRLDVIRSARARPLLVGDDPWTVDPGMALRAAGLAVLLWAAGEAQRARARGGTRGPAGRAACRCGRPWRPARGNHRGPVADGLRRLQRPGVDRAPAHGGRTGLPAAARPLRARGDRAVHGGPDAVRAGLDPSEHRRAPWPRFPD